MKSSAPLRLTFSLAIITALMLGQAILPPPREDLLGAAILDAGHVPLFGLLALIVLRLFNRWLPWAGRARIRHYFLTLGVVLLMGLLTEAAQLSIARDADAGDLARDLAGGMAMLLGVLAVDREMFDRLGRRSLIRAALLVLALGLVLGAFLPLTNLALGYRQRNSAFPRICDFESTWERHFIELRSAEMELVAAPAPWGLAPTDRAAHITLQPASYPALVVRALYPDWRGYDELAFEVFSKALVPIQLVLRIDDARHDNTYSDRFNRTLRIEPGVNRVRVALSDVRHAPRNRTMDMAHLRSLALFAVEPARPTSFYLQAIHLE